MEICQPAVAENLSSAISGSSHLDMVDPDHIGTSNGDSITAPHVLRVDLSEVDVLDDNVLNAIGHVDTLALDDTGGALADQGLVGLDLDRVPGSLVVCDGADGWRAGLVVLAPLEVETSISDPSSQESCLGSHNKECPLTLSLLMASWQPEAVP